MDNNSNLPPDQAFAIAQALATEHQAQEKARNSNLAQLKKVGSMDFGARHFDAAIGTIAQGVPNNLALVESLLESEHAPELVMQIAEDEGLQKQLATMTPQQQRQFVARLEMRRAPHGMVSGNEPSWRQANEARRVSDDAWRTNYGEGMSDQAWSREYDRRQAERFKAKRERGWG